MNYVSIGDVSLPLKKPLKPELVPVKYSKQLDVLFFNLTVCVVF